VEKNLTPESTYEAFEELAKSDERFEGFPLAERKTLFTEKIKAMKDAIEKARMERHQKKVDAFLDMLREWDKSGGEVGESWSKVKLKFRDEHRYQEINSSTEREKLYHSFVAEKKAAREEERRRNRLEDVLEERRREVEAQKERAMKEMKQNRQKLEKDEETREFSALVGEVVRDPYRHTSWEKMSEKMEGDKRYRSHLLTREEKKEIFIKHLESLMRRRREEFVLLLKTVDQVELTADSCRLDISNSFLFVNF